MIITHSMKQHLLKEIKSEEVDVARLCFHDNHSSMQIMLIALQVGASYEYFRNLSPGKIVFFGVDCCLQISQCTCSDNLKSPNSYNLSNGSLLILDKQLYRKTINLRDSPSIYAECIDGPFNTYDKQFLV